MEGCAQWAVSVDTVRVRPSHRRLRGSQSHACAKRSNLGADYPTRIRRRSRRGGQVLHHAPGFRCRLPRSLRSIPPPIERPLRCRIFSPWPDNSEARLAFPPIRLVSHQEAIVALTRGWCRIGGEGDDHASRCDVLLNTGCGNDRRSICGFASHCRRRLKQRWRKCDQTTDQCDGAEQQGDIVFFAWSHPMQTRRSIIGSAPHRTRLQHR